MTSHELARKLLEGPDCLVTVRGYEGGVDEVAGIFPAKKLYLNVSDGDCFGRHAYSRLPDERVSHTTQAVHIASNRYDEFDEDYFMKNH